MPASKKNNAKPLRILVVEDIPLIRKGVRDLVSRGLDQHDTVEIEEADTLATVQAFANQQFDLVILDLGLPDSEGRRTYQAVCEAFQGTRILIFSTNDDPGLVRETLLAGAAGFVQKSVSNQVLKAAINLVLAGSPFVPEVILRYPEAVLEGIPSELEDDSPDSTGTDTDGSAGALQSQTSSPSANLRSVDGSTRPDDPWAKLTPRQRQAMDCLIRGCSNTQIAQELGVAEGTVKSHLSSTYHALGVENRVQAVLRVAGIAPPDDAGGDTPDQDGTDNDKRES